MQINRKSDTQTKCEECKDNLKYYKDSDTSTYNCFSTEKDCPVDFSFLKKSKKVIAINVKARVILMRS